MIAVGKEQAETIADLVRCLGDIPTDRIMLSPPPGTATEADVLRYLAAPRKYLCELIDGVLVEKSLHLWKAVLR